MDGESSVKAWLSNAYLSAAQYTDLTPLVGELALQDIVGLYAAAQMVRLAHESSYSASRSCIFLSLG